MGAWIETYRDVVMRSHQWVAPYVGAWIETRLLDTQAEGQRSHPTWVRGLKHTEVVMIIGNHTSHPTWVRGLKHLIAKMFHYLIVAPYVGAWIETIRV